MKEKEEVRYIKRTQRDYSLSFKLQVVSEVESEALSIKHSRCFAKVWDTISRHGVELDKKIWYL